VPQVDKEAKDLLQSRKTENRGKFKGKLSFVIGKIAEKVRKKAVAESECEVYENYSEFN
jgi:hypothetical protein